MKYLFFSLFILVGLSASADGSASVLLDGAVKKMRADYPVRLLFSYSVFDAEGTVQFSDEGSLRVDARDSAEKGERYVLLTDPVKIWCDGETQWNYMQQTEEIYIMSPDDSDAQNFSPAHLMQLYKHGYDCSAETNGGKHVVTLVANEQAAGPERVIVYLDEKTLRPEMLLLYNTADTGYVQMIITDYKPKCAFENRIYRCPLEDFPNVDIVDMR